MKLPSVSPPVPEAPPPDNPCFNTACPASSTLHLHAAPPAEPVYAQPPPQEPAPVAASPSDVSAPPPAQPSESVDNHDEEPAPCRRKRRRQQEADDYDDFDDKPRPRQRIAGGRRQSGSRKMSGMNKGQTVIVVKGAGIGSKIFTSLIVLFVISLIVGIIGWGAYEVAPQVVGPILNKMGHPSAKIPPVRKGNAYYCSLRPGGRRCS